MKRIAKWIFVQILWPILKDLLKEVFARVIKAVFAAVRALLEKWRQAEEAAAKTEEERDGIRKRHEQRTADLNEAEGNVLSKVPDIVEDAMRSAEPNRDRLLGAPSDTSQLPGGAKP